MKTGLCQPFKSWCFLMLCESSIDFCKEKVILQNKLEEFPLYVIVHKAIHMYFNHMTC